MNIGAITIRLLLISGFYIGPASAAVIDSSSSSIINPEVSLGFDEVALSNGTTVVNQFASFGVSFSPQLTYLDNVSARPNFQGPALFNFGGSPFTIFDPFSLLFTNTVSDAVFAYTTNFGSTTFEALLNGSVIESFASVTNISAQSFYGFMGIEFDEIRVTSANGKRTGALDSLSFNTVAVPEPGVLPLFAMGALLLVGYRRKRVSQAL